MAKVVSNLENAVSDSELVNLESVLDDSKA
jgi:hypothetical protein